MTNDSPHKSIYNTLLDIEDEYNLFQIKRNGIYLWERVRKDIYNEIRHKLGIHGTAHGSSRSQPEVYATAIKNTIRNIFWKNPYLAKKANILTFGCRRRKKSSNGRWIDIYTDEILHNIDFDYAYVEASHFGEHFRPTETRDVRHIDLINNVSILVDKIVSSVSTKKLDLPQIKEVEEKIEDEFGIRIDITDKIRSSLNYRKVSKPLFKALIRKVDPEIVLMVTSYREDNRVVTEVCEELGVPTIELQHGVINKTHLEYNYPSNTIKNIFPDYFLSWGAFWKDNVSMPLPDDRIINVGYPYLDQRVTKYSDIESKEQILFISQGTIGEELSKFAMLIDEHSSIGQKLIYKLHPGEYNRWRDEYPWLIDADFEIIDESNQQLYRLFAESSTQIGVGSTAIYEGLAFGLDTYVYDCPGSEVLQPLIDEGTAELVSSTEELISSLGSRESSFEREYYFKPNATERSYNIINKLVENGTVYRNTVNY